MNDSNGKGEGTPSPSRIPDDLTLRGALGILADYAASPVLREEFEQALLENFGMKDAWDRLTDNDRVAFLEYFVFDRPLSNWGKPPARVFAESAVGLSDDMRARFLKLAAGRLDYYVVVRSSEGGVVLREVGGGRELSVADRQTGGLLEPGEVVLARVVEWDGEYRFSGVINRHRREDSEAFAERIAAFKTNLGPDEWEGVMRLLPRNIWLELKERAGSAVPPELEEEISSLDDGALMESARRALREREPARARAMLEKLVERNPASFEARFLLGSACLQAGDFGRAERVFRELSAEREGHTPSRLNLAVALSMRNRFEEALKEYQRCLLSEPDEELLPSILNGIGYLAGMLGDEEQSRKAFKEAVKAAGDDADALAVIASNMIQVGELKSAEKVLRKLVKLRPEDADIRAAFGDVLVQLDKPSAAVEHYRKAMELDPKRAVLLRNAGDALLKAGEPARAIEAYKGYMEMFPGEAEVWNNLGVACVRVGDLEKAEESFRKALALAPEYVSALSNLGKLMLELGRLDEAEEALSKARAAAPDNPLVKELALILEQEKRRRKAREKGA